MILTHEAALLFKQRAYQRVRQSGEIFAYYRGRQPLKNPLPFKRWRTLRLRDCGKPGFAAESYFRPSKGVKRFKAGGKSPRGKKSVLLNMQNRVQKIRIIIN
jgi:hypothetical protein